MSPGIPVHKGPQSQTPRLICWKSESVWHLLLQRKSYSPRSTSLTTRCSEPSFHSSTWAKALSCLSLLSFGASSNGSSCLQPYNSSLFWCLLFFTFFPLSFLTIKTAESLPSFHRFSQWEIKWPPGDRTHQLSLGLFSCDCQWLHWKRMCDLSTCFEGRKSESLPLEKAFLMCHGMHTYPRWNRSLTQAFLSPSPLPHFVTSWTLCFPSFLFSSQIPKFVT